MYELDKSLSEGNKEKAIECITRFNLNKDETKYGDDFGKAKDHIDSLLNSYRKITRITPLDILESMGLDKKALLDQGIFETTLTKTKGNVNSVVFEILVMNALPGKYEFVSQVHYCQDGAVKFKLLNFTGQTNPDYAIDIKDNTGNFIRIAFDSKAQKWDTFIKNLELRGLSYQIVTVGCTPDKFIKEHSVFQHAANNFNDPIWMNRFVETGQKQPPMLFMSTAELAEFINKKNTTSNDDDD